MFVDLQIILRTILICVENFPFFSMPHSLYATCFHLITKTNTKKFTHTHIVGCVYECVWNITLIEPRVQTKNWIPRVRRDNWKSRNFVNHRKTLNFHHSFIQCFPVFFIDFQLSLHALTVFWKHISPLDLSTHYMSKKFHMPNMYCLNVS